VDTWQPTLHTKYDLKEKPPTKDFMIKYNYTLQFIHCKETKKQNK
jgi:hypothetical protein